MSLDNRTKIAVRLLEALIVTQNDRLELNDGEWYTTIAVELTDRLLTELRDTPKTSTPPKS